MLENIEYSIRRRPRTKRLSISIHSDSRVVVSAPQKMPERVINSFVSQKKSWIVKSLDYYKNKVNRIEDIKLDKEKRHEIGEFIKKKLEEINNLYEFEYNKVYVKDHKSRWGSCSISKNLNFNYRVALLPEDLSDYIITHELCHLGEMNHSKKFWELVARNIPDHKERRRRLKKIIF